LETDLRSPEPILGAAARTLDFGRPMAVLLLGILHNIGDADDPYGIVRRLARAVASFFDGPELVEPGVVQLSQWRPRSKSESAAAPAQARKPAQGPAADPGGHGA